MESFVDVAAVSFSLSLLVVVVVVVVATGNFMACSVELLDDKDCYGAAS